MCRRLMRPTMVCLPLLCEIHCLGARPTAPVRDPPRRSRDPSVPPRACVPTSPTAPPTARSNRGRGRGCGSERRHHGSAPRDHGFVCASRCNHRSTWPLAKGGPCCPAREPPERALHHQRGPSCMGPPSLLTTGVSEKREGGRGEERGRERWLVLRSKRHKRGRGWRRLGRE